MGVLPSKMVVKGRDPSECVWMHMFCNVHIFTVKKLELPLFDRFDSVASAVMVSLFFFLFCFLSI